jgi:hypothetical protein
MITIPRHGEHEPAENRQRCSAMMNAFCTGWKI